MPSVVLSNLCWHTSDNTPLFRILDLTFGPLRTGLVGRNGTGKTTLLRLIAQEVAPLSGSIHTQGRVGYLHQNPESQPQTTLADLFGIKAQLAILDRATQGLASADDLALADWTLEARLATALAEMGLSQLTPGTPLATLSGGQRTRAGLAALRFTKPDIALLDEPTNHLDQTGRELVVEAVRKWQGCLIVASHDRALLAEMEAMVELSPLGAKTYGGNYDAYRIMKDSDLISAQSELMQAQRNLSQTKARATQAAERKARTDRQGRRLRASGSQPKILMDAAKARSEKSGAAQAALRDRMLQDAQSKLETAQDAVEILQPLTMDIPHCRLAKGRDVVRVENLCFAYSPGAPVFQNISLSIRGPERVALDGANGAGKSTLLACIGGQLRPDSGHVERHVPAARLDQDMSLFSPDETISDAFARLDPTPTENDRRAVLARFLFRGDEALQTIAKLSGGQRLRAGLACTLGHSQPKQLLILDEPNNHLDIDALETLESALNAYDGALLVVSHDAAFLKRIGIERRVCL